MPSCCALSVTHTHTHSVLRHVLQDRVHVCTTCAHTHARTHTHTHTHTHTRTRQIPVEEVPSVQKYAVMRARQLGKPAIVAHQLLHSMVCLRVRVCACVCVCVRVCVCARVRVRVCSSHVRPPGTPQRGTHTVAACPPRSPPAAASGRHSAAQHGPRTPRRPALRSQIEYPVPTRAEVADVADVVRQRADALMLSGVLCVSAV
jgi:hypothetical protein